MTNLHPTYGPTDPSSSTTPGYGIGPRAPSSTLVTVDPGRTLGIVGLVLSFLAALVGLIVSAVALRKSRRAGYKNGFALAGVIVGAVVTLVWVVVIAVGGAALGGVAATCSELGPGTHTVNGVTYTCG